MEGKRVCGFAAFPELTPSGRVQWTRRLEGTGGGVVISFFRGSAFTCLCVTERQREMGTRTSHQPALPRAVPGGKLPWGKGLGCEQWAESPAVSEGALCHPAPVGPPWGNSSLE